MNETGQKIRVVVVDDHQIVREGLRLIVEIEGEDMVLVGDAADGAAALRLLEETQPDVVLMDIRMPGMDGIEAVQQIRTRWPQMAVLILTTYNEEDLLLRGLQAGASGYLLKEAGRATLLHAIRTAVRGGIVTLHAEVMARLLTHTVPGVRTQASDASAALAAGLELTEREREVLTYVARGARSKEIAAQLGISTRTVTAHLTSIFTKLQVDSRASAVARAMEQGWLPRRG
jgi:NarL family two-component system response regulator YdfI